MRWFGRTFNPLSVLGAVTQLRDCTVVGCSADFGVGCLLCVAVWWVCGHLEDDLHAVTVCVDTVRGVALVIRFVLPLLSCCGACSVVDARAGQRVRLLDSM